MQNKKISFITTLYNEADSVAVFLHTLLKQSRVPDEIIIVDGGSTDGTADIIKDCLEKISMVSSSDTGNATAKPDPIPGLVRIGPDYDKKFNVELLHEYNFKGVTAIKVFRVEGARISEGRNIAIENSSNEFICVSDAGCILADNWIEEIASCQNYSQDKITVTGGYNYPYIENFIQACLAVCVMPRKDEIKKDSFMPSSRNIGFSKAAWRSAGGYPVNMDYGEDMRFNFNLINSGHKINFNPGAEVYWNLRNSLPAVFRQFFRYAKGDAIGRMYFIRHFIRFASLFFFALLIVLSVLFSPWILFGILPVIIYFMYKPYLRINYFLDNKKVNNYVGRIKPLFLIKVIIFFTIPMMMVYTETAKLVGYLFGIAVRKNF